jgi:hypothetical protein
MNPFLSAGQQRSPARTPILAREPEPVNQKFAWTFAG